MSDRKLTVFEYHSHGDGPRLFPERFLGGEETEEEAMVEADEEGDGRGIGPIIALLALVAAAAAYRYYRSRGGGTEFETDQVEVTEYEN